ncbi:MAG TPA: hypothetical protein DF383_11825 [Deltaproteobacteria bacterium]|nr:hypothetical protein [Deltaproteobacteria bacterium]
MFRRVPAELPVELEVGGATLQTTTANISCGGMFLQMDPAQLERQEKLDVLIHLPNRRVPVKLSAEILRNESQQRPGVALQFQGLYNDNILAIEKFVKGKLN